MRRRPAVIEAPPGGAPVVLWRFHAPQWWGPADPGPPEWWGGTGSGDGWQWPAIQGRKRWRAARAEWARGQGASSWRKWVAARPVAEQERYGH